MGIESQDWLDRARSSLSLAKTALTQDIFLEDLCFQAQQAVEKCLKGILVHQGHDPPRSHNIVFLLKEVSRYNSELNSPNPAWFLY